MSFLRWSQLARAGRSHPGPAKSYRPRLETLEERSLLSAGVLDPTFGNGAGYVATSVSQYSSGAEAVLIQPDGKILAAGSASLGTADAGPPEVFAVVRYKADGSLDTSFGTGGHAFADFPGAAFHGWRYSNAETAALYPLAGTVNDGKIVLAGEHDTKYGAVFALARFNANGTLDSTFGSDKKNPGEVTTTFATTGDPYQEAFGVYIQSDGKIVAAGTSSSGGFVLARYKANGTLDTTFGTGGEVITPFPGGVMNTASLLTQPDGKLIVVGETIGPRVIVMARYNPNGSLDTSFGTGGLVTSSVVVNNSSVKAALYPPGTPNSGEIVVVGQTPWDGTSGYDVEIARFKKNGTIDPTFGSGGTVTGQLGTNPAPAIAADGKLVISFAAQTSVNGPHQFGVARYNPDGTPDSTFGTNGYVTSHLGGYSAGDASAVAIQANGEIVTAGWVFFTEYNQYYPKGVASSDFAVVRYLPSEPDIGALKPTSNSDGSTLLTASNLSDGNPNSNIKQVEFFYFDANGGKVSLGYGALDGTGAWKLTVTLPAGTTLYAQAEDSYGVFGATLALTL